MPKISGLDRHQLTFSSLEATIVTDNDVRFIDAFLDRLDSAIKCSAIEKLKSKQSFERELIEE